MPMYEKYFARSGDENFPQDLPGVASGKRRPILYMDANLIPDTSFLFECSWLMSPFDEIEFTANDNDAMVFMCGPDRDDPENLYGEVEFTMDNDVHDITETCSIYIPAGCAHKLKVLKVDKPIMYCYCEFAPLSTRKPAEPKAPKGTYAKHVIYRYEPSSGIIPEGPEGFLQLLIWMAGDKVEGAPYLELCRFMTDNPTGPEQHKHPKEEFIGFIGTDPEHPEDLGAEVHFFLGGEDIATTKSTVIYVPGNVAHSPIIVPELHREIIHFSGSPASEYIREATD
ncbi:MAG: hypothetical protein ACOYIK_03530 [Coriobacteriales bacterium]